MTLEEKKELQEIGVNIHLGYIQVLDTFRQMAATMTPENKAEILDRLDNTIAKCANFASELDRCTKRKK